MAKAKEIKTNVMRILDREKVPYKSWFYDAAGPVDGVSVARSLGQNTEQVYKTLVTRGPEGEHFVFVIPVERELDLKAAARSVGEKSIHMIRVDELNQATGYIRGGCSPIGMKKPYRTVFDKSCQSLSTMLVSGGKIGVQVEVAPNDLLRLVHGTLEQITEHGA